MLTEFQKMSNKMMDACFAAQSFESKLKGVFKHLRKCAYCFFANSTTCKNWYHSHVCLLQLELQPAASSLS